jgi:hypothetical protein
MRIGERLCPAAIAGGDACDDAVIPPVYLRNQGFGCNAGGAQNTDADHGAGFLGAVSVSHP